MKKVATSLLLMLIAIGSWAQKVWNNPSFEPNLYSSNLNITDVEFKPNETILHLNIKSDHNFWSKFASTSILKTPDGKTYAITGGKATREGEDDYTPDSLYFTSATTDEGDLALHFEPLPAKTKTFDYIEAYEEGAFAFSDIYDITDLNHIPITSNWRSTTTGDWVLGLYKDVAVYDSKVWQYAQKTEKKIVLTDGKENITISIGKAKKGKFSFTTNSALSIKEINDDKFMLADIASEREFTINGKKQALTMFRSKTLPDYLTPDTTSFSTEIKEGEATLTGYIRNFTPEHIKNNLHLEITTHNLATGEIQNEFTTKVDSLGKFEIKIPLLGAQATRILCLYDPKQWGGSAKVILTPNGKYFIVADLNTNKMMFMGDDARLQNELQTKEALEVPYVGWINGYVSNDSILKVANKWKSSYDISVKKLSEYAAKHPNVSKRFLDFFHEKNRFNAAKYILGLKYQAASHTLPEELSGWVEEHSAINPNMPLTLCDDLCTLLRYIRENETEKNPLMKLLRLKSEGFLWLESKGNIKLTDEEHTTINKVKEKEKEIANAYLTTKNSKEFYGTLNKINRKYAEYNAALDSIIRKPDFVTAFHNLVQDGLPHVQRQIVNSEFPDEPIHSIHCSQVLSEYMDHDRTPIPDDLTPMLEDIKVPIYKEIVMRQNDYYKNMLKEKEKAVNAVIHPSSDVEGLTDGKAILDKLVAPYKGKIVYLDIWGTWCTPCKNKLKKSHKLKEELKDYDIVYLYLANNSPEDSWKNVIGEYNLTEPNCVHYNLPKEQQHAIEEYVELTGYPTYRLIDKQGGLHHLEWKDDEDLPKFKKILDELP